MKNERMVTRTITRADVEVLVCDVNTTSTDTIIVSVRPEKQYDHDKLLKKIKKTTETETLKVVAIVGYEEHENLYGMPESKFIESAEFVEPRA